MRLATASLVVALTLGAASRGQAAIITLQALDPAQGGEFSNLGPTNQQVADDFVLGATTSLDSFTWFGRYFADFVVANPVEFSIRIFSDAGGQPAAVPLHTVGVSVNASPTGLDFGGIPWFSYSSPLALILTAGTYWISVVEDDAATPAVGGSQWMWGDSTFGLRATRNGDVGPWTAGLDRNHAFTLEGSPVPEPSTLALSTLGLLGLLRYRRRRS